jgi:tetratricopeptide (TPR) repeat protein
MENVKKIIQYQDGDASETDAQIELKISENKRLKKIFELNNEINRISNDKGLLNFIEKTSSLRNEYSENPKIAKTIHLKNWFLAASIFIISGLLVFYFVNKRNPNDRIFGQFYSKYEISIATRSGIADINELTAAIQYYDQCQYKEAIIRFNKILSTDKNNISALFFSAVSYMEIKDYQKAAVNFKCVINLKDTAFAEHASWYLALCYIKTNNIQMARNIISQIAESDSYYRAKACELSKKLNNP